MIHVEIDTNSGFCFGVVRAIEMAENKLAKTNSVSAIGEMVHNAEEVKRLKELGLRTISCNDIATDKNNNILIRAHGEPPSTYQTIRNEGKQVIDATCPIVLSLQDKIKNAYEENPDKQIVIYGKPGHAEVIGLVGQTNGAAKVITTPDDIEKLEPDKPVILFSQTTMPLTGLSTIETNLKNYMNAQVTIHDTICRKVSHRVSGISHFAQMQDVCIFVSGRNSSNGRMLYEIARKANPETHFVSNAEELQKNWFADEIKVGVCGATSTPQWLMEKVKEKIERLF